MKVRPCCGGLAEAMEKCAEVKNKEELVNWLYSLYGQTVDYSTLEFKWYCKDERIGWNTYIVTGVWIDGTRAPVCYSDGIFGGEI